MKIANLATLDESNVKLQLDFDLQETAEASIFQALKQSRNLDFQELKEVKKPSLLKRIFGKKNEVAPLQSKFVLKAHKEKLAEFLQNFSAENDEAKQLSDQLAKAAEVTLDSDLSQGKMIAGAIRYFKKKLAQDPQNEDLQKLVKYFEDSQGQCMALSLLWSYSRLMDDLKHQQNLTAEIDGSDFFKRGLRQVCQFDEKKTLSTEQENEIERFLSHVIFYQNRHSELLGFKYKITGNFEDTKGRKFFEDMAKFSCSKKILARMVNESALPQRMLFFRSWGQAFDQKKRAHVISVYRKDDGRLLYYNSNDKSEKIFNSADELSEDLWDALDKQARDQVNPFGGFIIRPNHFILLDVEMDDVALTQRAIGLTEVSNEEFIDLAARCRTANDPSLQKIFDLLKDDQIKVLVEDQNPQVRKILLMLVAQKEDKSFEQTKRAVQLLESGIDLFVGEEQQFIANQILTMQRKNLRYEAAFVVNGDELFKKINVGKFSPEEIREMVGKQVLFGYADESEIKFFSRAHQNLKEIENPEVKKIVAEFIIEQSELQKPLPGVHAFTDFVQENAQLLDESWQERISEIVKSNPSRANFDKEKFLSSLQQCKDFTHLDLTCGAAVASKLTKHEVLQVLLMIGEKDSYHSVDELEKQEKKLYDFLRCCKSENKAEFLEDELFVRLIDAIKKPAGIHFTHRYQKFSFVENILNLSQPLNFSPAITALLEVSLEDEEMGEFLAKRYYGDEAASVIKSIVKKISGKGDEEKTATLIELQLYDFSLKTPDSEIKSLRVCPIFDSSQRAHSGKTSYN